MANGHVLTKDQILHKICVRWLPLNVSGQQIFTLSPVGVYKKQQQAIAIYILKLWMAHIPTSGKLGLSIDISIHNIIYIYMTTLYFTDFSPTIIILVSLN